MLAERGLVEKLVRGAFNVILDAIAALVRNDFFFARDLRLAEHEARHALALELHGKTESIRRQRFEVVGPVEPRGRVGLGAILLEHAIELARFEALRLVEHQVLEQVRKPGFSRLFVARAHAKPREVGDDLRAVVREHENAQSISEREHVERRSTKHVRLGERPGFERSLLRRVDLLDEVQNLGHPSN